jgi:uncharacterized protein involved in outer membrane biogenesis
MVRKIFFGVVIVLAVLFVALVIFVNTFNLNKYLPQITQQASQSIGREVKIENAKLHFSVLKGVAASVEGVLVGDDPAFGTRPFLTVGQIRCGVRFLPLLTKRRVEVSYILIHSPEVNIIKGKNGKFNFESMMKPAPSPSSPSGGASQGQAPSPSTPPPSLPVLLVSSFQIDKAKVTYADQSMTPPMEFAAQDIDVEVTDFSLTEPFKIKAEASLFSPAPNVRINGLGRLDMNQQQVRLDDVHVDADLSAIDIKKLNKTVPALEPVGIQSIKGNMNAVASQMLAGAGGLLVLSLEGQLSDARVALKPLAVPVDKIFMKFDASESKINVKEFFLGLASGEVRGQGVVKDYMTTQQFEFNADVNHLPLGEIIDQKNYPAQIKGSLSGNIKINGQGFTPEAMNKLAGESVFSIADGELVNMNIVKSVLDSISVLPGLTGIEEKLPPDFRQKISGKDTIIDKADVKTRIGESKVMIDTAQLEVQGCRLSAHGDAGFDQTIAMTTEMVFLKELAGALIASTKQLAALADESGEIHFPVNIKGKIPALSIMPDMNYISKTLLVNEGSKQLEKVIEKNPEVKKFLDIFTGGGQGNPSEDSSNTSKQEPANSQDSTGKKLLNNFLKGF